MITVDNLLGRWRFEQVQGTAPGVPRKPDPAGVLEIARRLGVQPAEMVYLGDPAMDMQAAVAAGLYPVGALWGFRNAGELLEGGAAMLAEKPQNLAALF